MSGSPPVIEVLERAARGEPVTATGVRALVRAWLGGAATDAQMAAFCMAVRRFGMDDDGVEALVAEVVASGDRLDLGSIERLVTLWAPPTPGAAGLVAVAAPVAAALGVGVGVLDAPVAGPAPGVLDLLAGIPGAQVDASLAAHVRDLRDAGLSVRERSERLVPADAELAALRAATGTLDCQPLDVAAAAVAAIAGGGRGAAVAIDGTTPDQTQAILGRILAPWGQACRVIALQEPGSALRVFGVALELREVGRALRGEASAGALRDLAADLAGAAAEVVGAAGAGDGVAAARAAIADGSALARAERWIEGLSGDPAFLGDAGVGGDAPVVLHVDAPNSGALRIDPGGLVEAIRWSGAGRMHRDQHLDTVSGIELLAVTGARVEMDEPVAAVHGRDLALAKRARDLLVQAVHVAPGPGDA